MSITGKEEIPLTVASLRRVDARVNGEIEKLVESDAPNPTAADVCNSLVEAINSEFGAKNVQIDAPLLSCAMGIASNDQILVMEKRIEDALNSRDQLLEAKRDKQAAENMRAAASEKAEANAQAAENVQTTKAQDDSARRALQGSIREVVVDNTWMPIHLPTAANAATTRAAHISADVGMVYGWDLDESTTYLGANIYTRPINTEVSLASLQAEGLLSWRHRFSFTLGATLESIEKAGQRKGIIGSNALVAGAGWRLTDVIRISAGVLIFEEENPNPLVTNDTSLAVSPYIGLSFDIDVAKQFGKVFTGVP